MARRAWVWATAVIVSACTGGASEVDPSGPSGPDDMSTDAGSTSSDASADEASPPVPPAPAEPSLVLSVPAIVTVRPGEAANLDVSVARTSVSGALHLEIRALPKDVTAATVDLAAGATQAALSITAAASAATIDGTIEIVATGISDGAARAVEAAATTTLSIVGKPGARDSSWGAGTGEAPGHNIRKIAIQPDGKVVALVGGSVFRWLADGSALDTSFGDQGRAVLPAVTNALDALLLQPDGKIVAVGKTGPSPTDLYVARVDATGAADPTFGGGDGFLTADLGGSADEAFDVALQSDGKLVVAGAGGATPVFALLRYAADGTPDASFGVDGVVLTDASAGNDYAHAVAIQPDKKIVVAGDANKHLAVARYDEGGALDTAFATSGIDMTYGGHAYAMALQPDGKILIAGSNGASNTAFNYEDIVIVRYDAAGVLDPTFGAQGVIADDIANRVDVAHAIAVQPDGKIVLAGEGMVVTQVIKSGTSTYTYYGEAEALIRYTSDGQRDLTFGVNGHFADRNGKSYYGLALAPDGKIVVGGDTGIARFWP